MKKGFLSISILISFGSITMAQNNCIETIAQNASEPLSLAATSGNILPPLMSVAEILLIPSPKQKLIIHQIKSTASLHVYTLNEWAAVGESASEVVKNNLIKTITENTDYLVDKNQFRVGIELGYFKTTDLQFLPNSFQSMRKNLQLGYSRRLKKGLFSTNLNVLLGTLTANSGFELKAYIKETNIYAVEKIELKEMEVSQKGFNLEVAYLHKLSKLTTSNAFLYVGGSLEECLTYTPGFLNVGTINYGSLNAKARVDYFLGNGKPIIFGLSVPIVSLLTKTPYHNAPNYAGKSAIQVYFTDNNYIATPAHLQNIRLSAKYNCIVRKRVAFDVSYQASWMLYNRYGHFSQIGNQLSLGFNF